MFIYTVRLCYSANFSHRLDVYWSYELCHGKHLRQYHEEKDAKDTKLQQYFLGVYNKPDPAPPTQETGEEEAQPQQQSWFYTYY